MVMGVGCMGVVLLVTPGLLVVLVGVGVVVGAVTRLLVLLVEMAGVGRVFIAVDGRILVVGRCAAG